MSYIDELNLKKQLAAQSKKELAATSAVVDELVKIQELIIERFPLPSEHDEKNDKPPTTSYNAQLDTKDNNTS